MSNVEPAAVEEFQELEQKQWDMAMENHKRRQMQDLEEKELHYLRKRTRELEVENKVLEGKVSVLRGVLVQGVLGRDRGVVDPVFGAAIPHAVPNYMPNSSPLGTGMGTPNTSPIFGTTTTSGLAQMVGASPLVEGVIPTGNSASELRYDPQLLAKKLGVA